VAARLAGGGAMDVHVWWPDLGHQRPACELDCSRRLGCGLVLISVCDDELGGPRQGILRWASGRQVGMRGRQVARLCRRGARVPPQASLQCQGDGPHEKARRAYLENP
jgi:hypothetical protein